MDSLIKEIAEVEKQIVKSAKEKETFLKNESKNKVPVKSALSDEKIEKNLSKLNDGSKNVTNEFQWLSENSTIHLPPEKEQELAKKLASAEWTKVKGKKKNKKAKPVLKEEPPKPAVNQDEKLETLLYQTEYQYNSRKKKKEKRKTEWELSSILESFSITEQSSSSMQMDTSGVSESSKGIKKNKKKKLKDRREKKGPRMDQDETPKPKLITRTPQAVLVDENDSIQPISHERPAPMTHKEKQRMRTQFRNKARKQKDRAERRKNKGFEEESLSEDDGKKGHQTKGIFVGLVSKAKAKKNPNKMSTEMKKNAKKMKKVMNNFNKFSVLE